MSSIPKFWDRILENFGTVFRKSRIVFEELFWSWDLSFRICCVFWCLGLFFAQAGNGKMD